MQHMAAGQCVGYCNDRVCITGCLFNHLFDGYTYIIIRRESLGVGTWTILVSVLVYFVISRCYTGKSDIWVYLYLGSFVVLAIGVIDRLGYDFLIMHDEIPLQYNIFISTIGNVNFWAAYLSMIVPFFMLATIFTRSRVRRACIYFFLLVAYFSLFITLTNTTYIGIGIAVLFVVWYSFQKK